MTLLEKNPVSNREVLERYGASHIMQKAWFSKNFVTAFQRQPFGAALKQAWHSLRCEIAREREYKAKSTRTISERGSRYNREYYTTMASR